MGGLAAATIVLRVVGLHRAPTDLDVPWWVLVPVFCAAEIFVVLLRSRRGAHSISLSEIPLVIGLAFSAPLGLVAARTLGGALALVFHRRQRGVKLAFNVSHFALEASLAVVVYHAVLGGSSPGAPIGWSAAFAATFLLDLLAAATITAAISMSQGGYEAGMLLETARDGAAAAVATTSLALVAVLVLESDPRAVGLLVVVAVILQVAYGAYSALGQSHTRMELLYAFTTQVGESVNADEVHRVVLAEAREALGARSSSLVLLDEDARPSSIVTLGEDATLEELRIEGNRHAWWTDALDAGSALVTKRTAANPDVQEGIAVALTREGSVTGVLLVEGHVDDVTVFNPDDVRLLETLANHTSVSLEKTALVDELRARAAEQQHHASHDHLTGLPNRRWFTQTVDELLQHAQGLCAVMLIDLDRFKEVNDTLGHHVGDELLRQVGIRLRTSLGDRGQIARLGGDEFAAFVQDVSSEEDAAATARHLLVALERPVLLGDLEIDVQASVGVAVFPDHGADSSVLLQRADVAMYEAKGAHVDVAIYDRHHDPYSPQRLSLASELRKTVEEEGLEVYFQPKVSVADGRLVGAEALVRWKHATRGLIGPDEFIPLAENIGLIRPLTTLVIRASLRECAGWRDRGLDVGIAVNITARSLLDDSLLETIVAELAEQDLPPHVLTLEITENSMMVDPQRSLAVLRRMHEAGLRLAIDDFGTGYSSLSYLKQLPVDEVKIDKSFLVAVPGDQSDATIVRSTVELGHNLGLTVVAEGVETGEALAWLGAVGCDTAQGYLFSRPVPSGDFERWARRRALEVAPPVPPRAAGQPVR
ncbi:MAG: putative Diguanylate cyclase/phosphodiesterase [Acidimicrobiales bacterium]|nr:putative Diguanylate cyclase/phosphodiesterase [Acidimicrobiales bacterium]